MLKDYKLKVGLFTHCIDCKDRHIGCHNQCAFYIADRNTLNERKDKVRKEELRTKTETVAYKYPTKRGTYRSKLIRKIED